MLWCRKLAYRGDHDPQHLTPKPVTDYCVWQVDDLPLSTSPPRRDPSIRQPLGTYSMYNGGQLWLVTRVEEYCFAIAGLLRARAKARTQTLTKLIAGPRQLWMEG